MEERIYKGYIVYENGRIRKIGSGTDLSVRPDGRVNLYIGEDEQETVSFKKLVYELYYGPIPEGMTVKLINDQLDRPYRYTNICLCTKQDLMRHEESEVILDASKIWKDIPGFEGNYKISNCGDVFSLLDNKMLAMTSYKDNSITVKLVDKNSNKKRRVVKDLVYDIFKGRNSRTSDIKHHDGDIYNNRIENLYEDVRTGGSATRIKPNSEYKIGQYDANKNLIKEWPSLASISESKQFTKKHEDLIKKYCKNGGGQIEDNYWRYLDSVTNLDGFVDLLDQNGQACPGFKIRIDGTILGKNGFPIAHSDNKGHVTVSIVNINGIKSRPPLHVLIARHFIKNPNNYSFVRHLDGNGLNNNITNLCWAASKAGKI